jgi:hypothetical protein
MKNISNQFAFINILFQNIYYENCNFTYGPGVHTSTGIAAICKAFMINYDCVMPVKSLNHSCIYTYTHEYQDQI